MPLSYGLFAGINICFPIKLIWLTEHSSAVEFSDREKIKSSPDFVSVLERSQPAWL